MSSAMTSGLVCCVVLVASISALANSQRVRYGRDLREDTSLEEPQGSEVPKCAKCDYNPGAIQLKAKEDQKPTGVRLKRYILNRRMKNALQERSNFMTEPMYTRKHPMSEGMKWFTERRGLQQRMEGIFSSRRIQEEDEDEECECDESTEDGASENVSKADDATEGPRKVQAGGHPAIELAEPWYDDDEEPIKPSTEKGNGELYESNYGDTEEEPLDPDGSTYPITSEPYGGKTAEVSDENNSRPEASGSGCKCVSIFQCGVSYRVGTSSKQDIDQCGEDEVCCPTVAAKPPTQWPVCGTAKPNYNIRLSESGRDRAVYGEFPWTVLITRYDQVHCAGTLIHPQIVLTAANCIFNQTLDSLTVQAAAYDLDAEPQSAVQPRLIDTYVIHPSFRNLRSLGGNLALLRLGDPIDMADDVNTICLASQLSDVVLNSCVANGWGRLPQAIPSAPIEMPKAMKKVQLAYYTREECEQGLRREFFGKTFRLSQGIFCAGGEKDVDMCTGDGGGPLTCPLMNGKGMVQIGLVAGGLGCGKENIPGFYIDVIHYRSWIEENKEKLLI